MKERGMLGPYITSTILIVVSFVGNVIIDGKVDDKGGAPETSVKE